VSCIKLLLDELIFCMNDIGPVIVDSMPGVLVVGVDLDLPLIIITIPPSSAFRNVHLGGQSPNEIS